MENLPKDNEEIRKYTPYLIAKLKMQGKKIRSAHSDIFLFRVLCKIFGVLMWHIRIHNRFIVQKFKYYTIHTF
jgi:hypothetical protein